MAKMWVWKTLTAHFVRGSVVRGSVVRGADRRGALIFVWVLLASAAGLLATGPAGLYKPIGIPPRPGDDFSPSNARTADGKPIDESLFFPAVRCRGCHGDTHAAWSESLHRNAGREPFYRESVDLLEKARGIEFTRHCESCHAPLAVVSGALGAGRQPAFATIDEGVTCSFCHSVIEARLDGTGSYTVRQPALLLSSDGAPVQGDVADRSILENIDGHRRAMMRPLLKRSEFCSVCHKSSVPPELNGYKSIRGFSAYDEWQQSGASHQTVMPFYRRAEGAGCRDCHMPGIPAGDDMAAADGNIASHRWLGANTAAPLFYGQKRQAELTVEFLRANVLSVDLFAVRNERTGERLEMPALQSTNRMHLASGDEITVEVVVANRNAAHSFPPELRDLYEAWVEFEALDATGASLFHSGELEADGKLDGRSHVYRAVLLDDQSRPIARHEVWLATVKAYDNAIAAGRSDLVRFRFRIPAATDLSRGLTLGARLNYRRFNQDYTDYVLRQQKAPLTIPVVRMAEAVVRLVEGNRVEQSPNSQSLRRLNDYGIALLEQAQYGAAAAAFRRAALVDPTDPNPLTSAALAEMKSERFAPGREQFGMALLLLERALVLDPLHDRTHFVRALALRGLGRLQEAIDQLARLAIAHPGDREVLRQYGQTLYALGRMPQAREAFQSVAGIDPTDAGAYQFLALLEAARQNPGGAERARALYLQWRDDPRADVIAARFFAAHPEWADERVANHTHHAHSPTVASRESRVASK